VPAGTVAQRAGQLRELLSEAVTKRLSSDAPLGLLLSGGLDSSSIAALAAAGGATPPTFSIGFRNLKTHDEQDYAGAVARHFGCPHRVMEGEALCAPRLARTIRHFDQPFGNPTSVLTYTLSELTRQSVTVALTGDGGDEMLGGYPRYVGAYFSQLTRSLPGFVRSRLLPGLGGAVTDDFNGHHFSRRLREFLEGCGQPLEEMYLGWTGYYARPARQALYGEALAGALRDYDAGDFLRGLWRQAQPLDPLDRLAYVDLKSFLCSNILECSDRMSMAHALELRSPFLDHHLVEWAVQLPFGLKFRHGQTKWLLRKAMQPLLPRYVLKKPKRGFNPPVSAWLGQELKRLPEALLSPEAVQRRGLFRPEAVRRLVEDHSAQRRDLSRQLWALVVLEIWCRLYLDRAPLEAVEKEIGAAMRGARVREATA
jgi:asparagine synthase (glutamine-hydrolysing)